jgi:asparagine synthase (glutamine-hydrolysing)
MKELVPDYRTIKIFPEGSRYLWGQDGEIRKYYQHD